MFGPLNLASPFLRHSTSKSKLHIKPGFVNGRLPKPRRATNAESDEIKETVSRDRGELALFCCSTTLLTQKLAHESSTLVFLVISYALKFRYILVSPPLLQEMADPAPSKYHQSGCFITLAQLHRLLRPLQTKVKKLSDSLIVGQGRLASSHSHRSRPHPFSPIPHPTRLQSRTFMVSHPEWVSLESIQGLPVLELSSMIYAVCDAFRNTLARVQVGGVIRHGPPPLSGLCAALLGKDIEPSVRDLFKESNDGEEDDSDDETYAIDRCYESIPEHLRR